MKFNNIAPQLLYKKGIYHNCRYFFSKNANNNEKEH